MKSWSLHIGLNQVDPNHYKNADGSGWNGQLYGCEADAEFYQQLATTAGFARVVSLSTAKATSDAVKQEITAAKNGLATGDLFLITYSGHGGQVEDQNGDEPDRLDETLCLYDRQFIDDELFDLFAGFQPGVNILMFSDSCHSGSVARATVPNTPLTNSLKTALITNNVRERVVPPGVLVRTYQDNKEEYGEILSKTYVTPDHIATFVILFAACQDQETAKEQGIHGIFTATVQQALAAPGAGYTYRSLFDAVKNNIAPSIQVPNFFTYGKAQFDFSSEAFFAQNSNPLAPPIQNTSITPSRQAPPKVFIYKKNNVSEKPIARSRSTEFSNATDWDEAYNVYKDAPATDKPDFVEPDVSSQYLKIEPSRSRGTANNYLTNWPKPNGDPNEFIWHLSDNFSQLRKASDEVQRVRPNAKIRIGHIDVGYRNHISKPKNLLANLGTSFVGSDNPANGEDQTVGNLTEIDGHGCGTCAILAGNFIDHNSSFTGYEGFFGAIPFAEIVPIRICDTVYNSLSANDVARGIEYAVDNGCQVITMSMAGVATRRVANAVNYAYEKGVVVVTAAGNNWQKKIGKLAPKAVLYPARFDRVIAATGAAYNHEPYYLPANSYWDGSDGDGDFMQGNHGPANVMKTAVAAYTPNLPWADFDNSPAPFRKAGGGTSAATPQVAATAALWLVYNEDKLAGYEGWQKVEAARKAIFDSASKSLPAYQQYYGNGIIRAFDALNAFDTATRKGELVKSPEAHVSFLGIKEFIQQWQRSRSAVPTAPAPQDGVADMMALEIVQVIFQDDALKGYADVLEVENAEAWNFLRDPQARATFFGLIKQSPYASNYLKANLPL
jgi:hypothetical protein